MNNTIESLTVPAKTIKCPKDFSGDPQANTLSDIIITRAHFIYAIKSIRQNSSGGPDQFPAILHKQCNKSLAHPLHGNCCTMLQRKQEKY